MKGPSSDLLHTDYLFYQVFGSCCFLGQLLTSCQQSSVPSGAEGMPNVLFWLTPTTPVFNSLCVSLVHFGSHDFSRILSSTVPDAGGVTSIFHPSYYFSVGHTFQLPALTFLLLRALSDHGSLLCLKYGAALKSEGITFCPLPNGSL